MSSIFRIWLGDYETQTLQAETNMQNCISEQVTKEMSSRNSNTKVFKFFFSSFYVLILSSK